MMQFDMSEHVWICLNMSEHVSRHLVQSYFTNETVLKHCETHVKNKIMQFDVSDYVWLCLNMYQDTWFNPTLIKKNCCKTLWNYLKNEIMQFDVFDYIWTCIKILGSNIFYWWNSIKKHNEIHVKTKIMKFVVSECQAC